MNRDSSQYISIAQSGYTYFPCNELDGAYFPGKVLYCGNAGWFPGYPFALRPFIKIGIPAKAAGLVLSHIFLFAFLIVAYNIFCQKMTGRQSLACLCFIAVSPGSVYYQAVSPISMFLFFALTAVGFAFASRHVFAGAAGFVAGFTHPASFLLALILGAAAAHCKKESVSKIRAALFAGGLTLAGFASAVAIIGLGAGTWNAFFKVQALLGLKSYNPFENLSNLLRCFNEKGLSGELFAAHAQTFVVFGVLIFCFAYFARKDTKPLPVSATFFLAFAAIVWTFFLCTSDAVYMYRAEALLLPLAFVLARLGFGVQAFILICLTSLKIFMIDYFFNGVLI